MSPSRPKSLWMIYAIMAAVLVWGLYHAVGVLLGGDSEFGKSRYPRDLRRGAIVLGCVVAFLGGWAWLVLQRERRINREAAKRDSQPPTSS